MDAPIPDFVSVVSPEPRHITKLALDQRFTDTEFQRIEDASNGIGVTTMQALKVRRAQILAEKMSYCDLDRTDTRNYVLLMDSLGLLDHVGRSSEILNNPVQDWERYKG